MSDKYDNPSTIARELSAKAALIDDRNKGGQLQEITDDMRKMSFRLARWNETAKSPLLAASNNIVKRAIEALDYIQHDWQQKDGTEVFQEQCEEIRAALTASASMEAQKVWIVEGSTGEYSDHCEWRVCAFFSEDAAKAFAEELSALGREAYEIRSKGNYEWRKTKQGKALLEKDPDVSIDYTGVNYTAYCVDIRPAPPTALEGEE